MCIYDTNSFVSQLFQAFLHPILVDSHQTMSRYLVPLCCVAIIMAAPTPTDVSGGINTFSHKLYNAVSGQDKNLIFSPFSVHAVLSVVYQGAVGETARALKSSLNVPEPSETAVDYKEVMTSLNAAGKVDIRIANKIYVKSGYKLKESFRSIAQDNFFADVENIDFNQNTAAAANINAWVENKTNSRIKNLVKPDDFEDLTVAVLLNAIYFKGNWLRKFNAKFTHEDKFYHSENDTSNCKMMRQTGNFEYGENADLDAKILKMKYSDERFGMTILLPNSKTGIDQLETKIGDLNINSLRTTSQSVMVRLPKFKLESSIDLKEPLIKLGFANIFSDVADFSNIFASPESVKVSKVIQKAFVEVNEEGSEAAAATGLFKTVKSHPTSYPQLFIADHPFIFYITAKIGTTDKVLFMGKLASP